MFENKEYQKLERRIKEYERSEENRRLQKQNIIQIEHLEDVLHKLVVEYDMLKKSFDEEVKLCTEQEIRKLLNSYNTSSSRIVYNRISGSSLDASSY